MAITTRDQLIASLAGRQQALVIDKSSIPGVVAGQYYSLWRANGIPGQGAIPGAAAVCNNVLTGALPFYSPSAPDTTYLATLNAVAGNSATSIELHDRLVHMGGLNGTLTSAQTVGIDMDLLLATNNLDARISDAFYRNVMWWLEWYTDTGATVVTATVNVKYSDGSSANLYGIALAATRRASQMIPLNSYIPLAQSGLSIAGVNSVTLSATTGTAGSFGVTATKRLASLLMPIANANFGLDWAGLGLMEVKSGACPFVIMLPGSTTTGRLNVNIGLIEG